LLVHAETRPDFSGVWQQMNDRCVPKPKDKHASYRLVIDQNGSALRLGITTNKGSLHLDYVVAGGELVYTGLDGDQFHTKVRWDGPSLVFDTVEYERGHKVLAKEVWTLTDASRTLRRVKEEDEPGEHSTATYILEKQ
jgi:hypothetical protein